MSQRAIVTAIQNNSIQVLPLIKEECSACTAGCAKQGSSFVAENPHNYPINIGNVVVLETSKTVQAVQGIISLVIPFLCAVGGYFLAPFFARLIHIQENEAIRALCVLLFLFCSCALIFFLTRTFPLKGKPSIVEVYTS